MESSPILSPASYHSSPDDYGVSGALPGLDSGPALTLGIGLRGHLEKVLALLDSLRQQLSSPTVLQAPIGDHQAEAVLESIRARWRGGASFARDDQGLINGHLHVAPPGMLILVRHRRLRLRPVATHEATLDRFFSSLAQSEGVRSVAVLLETHAPDGLLGLFQVSRMGGVALAEAPAGPPSPIGDLNRLASVLPTQELAHHLEELDMDWHLRASPTRAWESDHVRRNP